MCNCHVVCQVPELRPYLPSFLSALNYSPVASFEVAFIIAVALIIAVQFVPTARLSLQSTNFTVCNNLDE